MGSQFDDTTVLVTGGGSGIGKAVVDRFVSEGASICVIDIDGDALGDLKTKYGDSIQTIQGDVRDYSVHETAVDAAVDSFGKIDTLIGNAGIFDMKTTLASTSPEDIDAAYRELFDVNVLGYLYAARATIGHLRDSGGTMIFTSSCSGNLAWTGGTFYVPSKHAVDGLIRRLALELAPDIRVNGVAPGYVPTKLAGLDSLNQGQSPPSPHLEAVHPIGRIPEPEEYAGYYTFLADSNESAPSTGTIIKADSGLSIASPT